MSFRDWIALVFVLGCTFTVFILSLAASFKEDQQATLIGSLLGSFLGLVAILLGALFNAHLNRQRDDRLRGEETFALLNLLKLETDEIGRCLKISLNAFTKLDALENDEDWVRTYQSILFTARMKSGWMKSEKALLLLGHPEYRGLIEILFGYTQRLDSLYELMDSQTSDVLPNSAEDFALYRVHNSTLAPKTKSMISETSDHCTLARRRVAEAISRMKNNAETH